MGYGSVVAAGGWEALGAPETPDSADNCGETAEAPGMEGGGSKASGGCSATSDGAAGGCRSSNGGGGGVACSGSCVSCGGGVCHIHRRRGSDLSFPTQVIAMDIHEQGAGGATMVDDHDDDLESSASGSSDNEDEDVGVDAGDGGVAHGYVPHHRRGSGSGGGSGSDGSGSARTTDEAETAASCESTGGGRAGVGQQKSGRPGRSARVIFGDNRSRQQLHHHHQQQQPSLYSDATVSDTRPTTGRMAAQSDRRGAGAGGRGSNDNSNSNINIMVPLMQQASSYDIGVSDADDDDDDEDHDHDGMGWGQVVVQPVKVALWDKKARRWSKTQMSLPELRGIILERAEKTQQIVTYSKAASLVSERAGVRARSYVFLLCFVFARLLYCRYFRLSRFD